MRPVSGSLLGDDYGAIGFAHGTYGGELDLYVNDAGLAPLAVIRWATRNGAALMGRSDQLGSVEPGMLADLLVVDGDPSTDIGVLADRRPRASRAARSWPGSLVPEGR